MSERPGSSASQRSLDPLSSRPQSQNQNDEEKINKKDPLPPIKISDSPEPESPRTWKENDTRPTILKYRRETSPTNQSPRVNAETQTEWSWLDDMRTTQRSRAASKASTRSGRASRASRLSPSIRGDDTEDDLLDSDQDGLGTESPMGERKTPGTSVSRQVDSELTFAGSEASIPYPPKEDEYGIPQLVMSDSESSDSDSEVEQYTYKPAEEQEEEGDDVGTLPSIGPPQILQYQRESEKAGVQEIDPDTRKPEAGLSQEEIKKLKEQYKDQGMFEGTPSGKASATSKTGEVGGGGGKGPAPTPQFYTFTDQFGPPPSPCEFCQQPVKPFPTLEQQKSQAPEDLYCCNEYQEFVKYILTHPVAAENQRDRMIDIKPHAPYGSGQARKAAKERAAQRMRERELAKQQAHISQGKSEMSGGGGGGGPTNFYQSKAAKVGSKIRGDKERDRGGASVMSDTPSTGFTAAASQIARQMKTINYSLSSQKCLEEGWTVRPPTPLDDADRDPDVFEPEPLLPSWAEAEGKASQKRQLVQKYYEDGKLFVILFPDGTGTVFYPSGRPAVTISSHERGLYNYVAQDDHEDPVIPNTVAVFDSSGYAASYYNNTNQIRICLDQVGGIELDPRGGRKRKWSWKDQVTHVHAPPLQPITYSVTPHISVRIMNQDNITLTFTAKNRSVRFQTGARLKLVAPEFFPDQEIDEDEMYRAEMLNRIESLFSKVANLLKFPNSPKLTKLPEPKHVTSKVNKMEKIKEVQTSRRQARKEKRQNMSQPIVTVN